MRRPGLGMRLATAAWAAALALAPTWARGAVAAGERSTTPLVETSVGMEGVYWLRTAAPPLAAGLAAGLAADPAGGLSAAPVDDNAPIVLRIANVSRDDKGTTYELRYIGIVPGIHDLSRSLRGPDGQTPPGLGRIPVRVHAVLPDDHNGLLDELDWPASPASWPYRLLVTAAVVGWAAWPAWRLVRRLTRRSAAAPAPVQAREPTLADQLTPLVEAAIAQSLDEADRARLELLLLAVWRRRLRLEGSATPEVWARMRQDSEAGPLLRGLQQWLYEPPDRGTVDLDALLTPYRHAPAVELGDATAAAGRVQEAVV